MAKKQGRRNVNLNNDSNSKDDSRDEYEQEAIKELDEENKKKAEVYSGAFDVIQKSITDMMKHGNEEGKKILTERTKKKS